MKRDMDLARAILLKIEEQPFTGAWVEITIDGYSPDEITYHVMLLAEAGLIDADDVSSIANVEWMPKRLTWEGHEFLDAARDNNRWNKAKNTMEKFGGFVFEIGKQVLLELIKSELRSNQLIS
jgi:DNA-binding transcriptional ArsR family regulator